MLKRNRIHEASAPGDLSVLQHGMEFVDSEDALDHFWYEMVEREAGETYCNFKVVKLAMLRYLPQENRLDAGLVARQRSALVGLYNSRAHFDLVHLVAGMFDPALGVIQCYGVASSEPTLDEAQEQADLGMAALQGVLANYAQARFEALNVEVSAWLMEALAEMPRSLVVIGHPDPRENARGGGRESPDEPGQGKNRAGQDAYTQQQNEMLFRGMSALQEEFVWLLLAHRVHQAAIARMLAGIAGEASVWASRMMGTKGISFGLSVPIIFSGGFGRSAGTGFGESAGRTTGRSVGETEGTAHTEGEAESYGHSTSTGSSHTVGVAHSSGGSTGVTRSSSWSVSESEGESSGVADSHGTSENWGESHTEGSSSSSGGSSSHSTSTTSVPAIATQSGGVTSVPEVTSHSETHTPDVASVSATHSPEVTSHSAAHSPEVTSHSSTRTPEITSQSESHTPIITTGSISHRPEVSSVGAVQSSGEGGNVGAIIGGVNFSSSQAVTGNITNAYDTTGQASTGAFDTPSESTTPAHTTASLSTTPQHTTTGESTTPEHTTTGASATLAHTTASQSTTPAHQVASSSWSVTPAHSVTSSSDSSSSFSSTSRSVSDGTSHGTGESESRTESEGASQSTTRSRGGGVASSSSSFQSTTQSEAWGTMQSETDSYSRTKSEADTVSRGTSRAAVSGASYATVLGRSLAASRSMGISGGVIPSVTASKSYQWVDDAAAQVAQMLRTQEVMLQQASLEGAYLADVYMLTRTDRGRSAAEALVRQAFHGTEDVVTAVLTRNLLEQEQNYIRQHAMAFTPSTRIETIPGLLEGYKDSTLLTMLMLAAYTAPGMYEQGIAITTQERIPPFAFMPDLKGEVILAHQWSTEIGKLTTAPVCLSEERHMHTAFIGDTGYGKTVAAERLCIETAVRWRHRNIVLDFGAGWRKMFHAPIDRERVDIWQLHPGSVRPLRWNPLQIGKRILPERQLRATTELFANAGQMGPRQLGLMRRALRELYVQNGVLTSDREILSHRKWGQVQAGEDAAINAFRQEKDLPRRSVSSGQSLADLDAVDRQAVAIHRSKQVDVVDWYEILNAYRERYKKDRATLTSLEGVLLRLDVFAHGEMALMYGKGEGTIAIEDLGLLGPPDDPWGVAVLEGGAEMDEYAKATLLGLLAWHLYNDAVVRRREVVSGGIILPTMNIFWEEANKVLGGVAGTVGSDDDGGLGQITELYQMMWRDGRKYKIYNHPLLQTVSDIAAGIFSSCNNLFLCQTKAIKDRDMALAAMAKSEKGFTDEEYKRFVSRMPLAMAVCKLGYGWETYELEPMLTRPLLVDAKEPTDSELLAWYQVIDVARRH